MSEEAPEVIRVLGSEFLPGEVYGQKVRSLEDLAGGLAAVMVSYLERAGEGRACHR